MFNPQTVIGGVSVSVLVLGDVAAMLKSPAVATGAPPYWLTVVSLAQQRAYGTMLDVMIARGYVLAQFAAWDRGAEFERALSLYFTLTEGGGLEGFDDRYIKTFDRREELLTTNLTIAGIHQDPQGYAGQVSTGRIQGSGETPHYRDHDGTGRRREWSDS
jgi:hypothetical protein